MDHTGSPKLGCHFQNSENFGKLFMNTLVTGDGGLCFIDFCYSRTFTTRMG